MNKKERERQFEEINGRKRSESKLTPNKKIKIKTKAIEKMVYVLRLDSEVMT